MSYHSLETLLNVDSPAARFERPYEFPDSVVTDFVAGRAVRDSVPGRGQAAPARRRLRDRGSTRSASPPNHGSRQGKVHGPAGPERRRLRTAQRPARHQSYRRTESVAPPPAPTPAFHRRNPAAPGL